VIEVTVRRIVDDDRPWAAAFLRERWGGSGIVTRGRMHNADRLPGFVALRAGDRVGLATCRAESDACELVSLDSLAEGCGVGSMLVRAVCDWARTQGCHRVWLITTNDNWPAMRFYLKRGFVFVAVYRGAIIEARRLKPEIAVTGFDGIPITDEIEMELVL
jgi:GNAT superfamily N-acetyltransferase